MKLKALTKINYKEEIINDFIEEKQYLTLEFNMIKPF